MALALFLAIVAVGVKLVDMAPELLGESDEVLTEDDVLVLRFGAPYGETETQALTANDLANSEDYHVVRTGDTLTSIAQQRLGDPALADELALLNGLDDPDDIAIGQVLRLR